MAGAWAAAARQAGNLSRFSSPSLSATQASKLIQRRGLSGGGGWAAAARQAGNLSRFSSPSLSATQASKLIQRRGLSGGGDHHDPPIVNDWNDPMSLSRLKEVQFAILSLTGWGLLIYGCKVFQRWQEERESCGEGGLFLSTIPRRQLSMPASSSSLARSCCNNGQLMARQKNKAAQGWCDHCGDLNKSNQHPRPNHSLFKSKKQHNTKERERESVCVCVCVCVCVSDERENGVGMSSSSSVCPHSSSSSSN